MYIDISEVSIDKQMHIHHIKTKALFKLYVMTKHEMAVFEQSNTDETRWHGKVHNEPITIYHDKETNSYCYYTPGGKKIDVEFVKSVR